MNTIQHLFSLIPFTGAGRPGLVPDEDVKEMALLAESLGIIEQNNGEKMLTKSDLITLFGQMANEKLARSGKEYIETRKLFACIQKLNSSEQTSKVLDSIEARHVCWLTYHNLNAHYIKWEKTLILLGFG